MDYRLPKRYLDGNVKEMLFWDAVYFLMETRGETGRNGERYVETSITELETLTGLSGKSLNDSRNKAGNQSDKRYNLIEQEAMMPHGIGWILARYEELLSKNAIEKPTGLFKYGWLKHLYSAGSSRFPFAVVNLLLRKPVTTAVGIKEIIERCRKPGARTLPDVGTVSVALDTLQTLGLIEEVDPQRYRLRRGQFETPVGHVLRFIDARQNVQKERFVTAYKVDPLRAKLAEDLMQIGHFDSLHFLDIFRDVQYVTSEREKKILAQTTAKFSNKPPSTDRWQRCWQNFQQQLTTKTVRLATEKEFCNLAESSPQVKVLPPVKIDPSTFLWSKLVVWIQSPDYVLRWLTQHPDAGKIKLALSIQEEVVRQEVISLENEIVRWDLTQSLKQSENVQFSLTVDYDPPVPHVTLAIVIELCHFQRSP